MYRRKSKKVLVWNLETYHLRRQRNYADVRRIKDESIVSFIYRIKRQGFQYRSLRDTDEKKLRNEGQGEFYIMQLLEGERT